MALKNVQNVPPKLALRFSGLANSVRIRAIKRQMTAYSNTPSTTPNKISNVYAPLQN